MPRHREVVIAVSLGEGHPQAARSACLLGAPRRGLGRQSGTFSVDLAVLLFRITAFQSRL